MSNNEYKIFNVLIVALLVCSFFLGFLMDSSGQYPSCQILEQTGKNCKSCGLTRDFLSFIKLNFSNPLNRQSIFVFIWFVFQLSWRAILLLTKPQQSSKIQKIDLIISVITGMVVFLPFWI